MKFLELAQQRRNFEFSAGQKGLGLDWSAEDEGAKTAASSEVSVMGHGQLQTRVGFATVHLPSHNEDKHRDLGPMAVAWGCGQRATRGRGRRRRRVGLIQ